MAHLHSNHSSMLLQRLIKRRPWLPSARSTSTASGVKGLFGLPKLYQAQDWQRLAKDAMEKCDSLIDDITLAPGAPTNVRLLDTISDTVCQVFDAAELCRNVHAEPAWQQHAQQACVELGDYVQRLNMHTPLYNSLVAALQNHERLASSAAASTSAPSTDGSSSHAALTKEAVLVGMRLRSDFEKSGIHLPEDVRARLLDLRSQEQLIGFQMGQNLLDPSKLGFIDIDRRKASIWDSLPHTARQSAQPAPGGSRSLAMRIGLDSGTLNYILRWAGDATVRKQAYVRGNSSPQENLALLERLVAVRRELAHLQGWPSFAHYQADPSTIAASPDAVVAFLEELAVAVRGKAEQELALLARHSGAPASTWDRQHQMGQAKADLTGLSGRALADYFSLEACIRGIQLIVEHTMGMVLKTIPLSAGEGWADDVIKMELQHPDTGVFGHMYLDLHPRRGKFQHAAHFTLRSGKRLPDGSYQTPLMALVCNFEGGPGATLSHSEAGTFFHEIGHALHALLSRTEFQHLSGTRGALDIVEIPSHLMEHFINDWQTLRLFARHTSTGDPMPKAMFDSMWKAKRLFGALDLQQQVLFALLDLDYHGLNPPGPGETTQRFAELAQRHTCYPLVPGTCPQVRLGHLVGYGGSYYSYLYASSLASTIWDKHFQEDPLSRHAGDHVRKHLLEAGSAVEPMELVNGLLGPGALRQHGSGWMPHVEAVLKPLQLAHLSA